MKQEYISAFMLNNQKKFNEVDLPAIQKRLEKLDDKYFPMLMGLKLKDDGITTQKVIIIIILVAGLIAIMIFAFLVWLWNLHDDPLWACMWIYGLLFAPGLIIRYCYLEKLNKTIRFQKLLSLLSSFN